MSTTQHSPKMQSRIMTKTLISIATLLFIPVSFAATTDQQITTDDGREVLLKVDGRWEYRSTDRFANTDDGRRVRLKEDGSWAYTGNAPLQSKTQVRTADLDIQLKKVVIETYRKKTQKSARIKTQTVFYVQLNNSTQAKAAINIENSDAALVEVMDNNGKTYPVLSISPALSIKPVLSSKAGSSKLQPGAETILTIRAEKSPSIFDDVKSMEISFKAGIYGIKNTVSLIQNVTDFENEEVDGFK